MEASFSELPSILKTRGVHHVDGLLLDLGLSSRQLQDQDRGFSFLRPGPLDMRMSQALVKTAWDVLVESSEMELAEIFRTLGEEPQARRIARALKEQLHKKKLPNDAWQVAEVIRRALPRAYHRIDPATRAFQALRLVVNAELSNLEKILSSLEGVLKPGGRAAIISFHSLEDRRVKRAFQQAAKGCICPPQAPQCTCGKTPWARLLSRKAIQPSKEEITVNPRARSARLRVLEKLGALT
jgi:16S rRNA (cytosine1402-N4)-methyltransferase